MTGFYRTYFELLDSIYDLVSKDRIVPALILLYTGIDSFSWLSNSDEKMGIGKRFINWVDKWIISQGNLPCTANEIYSARNGLLHRQASKSEISCKGSCREILYAWGDATSADLQRAIIHSNNQDTYVAVQLEKLIQSFRIGLTGCFKEINNNASSKDLFNAKAQQLFVSLRKDLK